MPEKVVNNSYAPLCQAIEDHFGEDTRFYTCSMENITAAELVDFLQSRGKFIEQGPGFNTRPDKICGH